MRQLTDEVFAQVRETVVNARNRLGATRMSVGGEDEAALWDQYTAQLAALDTAQPEPVNAMLVEALEQAKRWHQGDKWRDDPDNRSVWEDHMTVLNTAIAAAKQAQPERAPLTMEQCKAKFEAWYASAPDEEPEPDRTYELSDESMSELTKECIWLGWQAAYGIKQGGQHEL